MSVAPAQCKGDQRQQRKDDDAQLGEVPLQAWGQSPKCCHLDHIYKTCRKHQRKVWPCKALPVWPQAALRLCQSISTWCACMSAYILLPQRRL